MTGTVLKFALVVDVTASQQPNINAIREYLKKIINDVMKKVSVVVEIALVLYTDHEQNGEKAEFVTKVVPFSRNVQDVLEKISNITASGGGDLCEAVGTAMHKVLTELDWSVPPDSFDEPVNMAVWITDAPGHGIGGEGDFFPNGCPGFDSTELSQEFVKKGICVSVAACRTRGDPRITSPYSAGNAWFRRLASITGGAFVNLGDAQQLVAVVTNTAVETVELNALADQVQFLGVESVEEIPDHVYRSLSDKSATLTQCDEELCQIDQHSEQLDSQACVSPVLHVKTDKEFKDAFKTWCRANMPQMPTGRNHRYTRARLDDDNEGDPVYRSLGAAEQGEMEDVAPIPATFTSSPPHKNSTPRAMMKRSEKTIERLKVICSARLDKRLAEAASA